MISIVELIYLTFTACKKKQRSNSDEKLSKFAEETSIHGVKYVLDSSLKSSSRIFWIFVFLTTISGCGFIAIQSYTKLNIIPEIDTDISQRELQDIPFPAITVCAPVYEKNFTINFQKFMRDTRSNKYILRENITKQEENIILANLHWCMSRQLVHVTKKTFNLKHEVEIVNFMNISQLDVDELFTNCQYQGKSEKCSKIFNRVLTDFGFCYTFNFHLFHSVFNKEISKDFNSYGRSSLEDVKWTIETGYQISDRNAYPLRASKVGELQFDLKISARDASNLCTDFSDNFFFFVHRPSEIITPLNRKNPIKFQSENDITLTAKSLRVSEKLRDFSPHNRECYFKDERKLQFFNTYSKLHCEFECMTNYIIEKCKCVKFSMPRNDSMKICNFAQESDCYSEEMLKFPMNHMTKTPCDCYPACNNIIYESQIKSKKEKFIGNER